MLFVICYKLFVIFIFFRATVGSDLGSYLNGIQGWNPWRDARAEPLTDWKAELP